MRFSQFAVLTILVALGLYKTQSYARQKPIPIDITSGSPEATYGIDDDWGFKKYPRANSTDHLLFDSVNSLLQRWPNTRYRNGHTLVPGIIPTGTLLYHGNIRKHFPPGPEWIAMDPEHSLMFCIGSVDTGCWHITLAATRPLNVLYFDGSSAAKMSGGPMDLQDVLIWGEEKPHLAIAEEKRICDLCGWGKEFGIDGFVRMEMGFEVMLCNFTSGVETLSFLNLVSSDLSRPHLLSEYLPPNSPCDVPPPPDPSSLSGSPPTPPLMGPLRNLLRNEFNTIDAGSWHNHHPGDMRIQLDFTRLISMYDTNLFPSLVSLREGKERWEHRIAGISAADAQRLRRKVEDAMKSGRSESGVDWPTLFRTIADRYEERLELLQYLLDNPADSLQGAKRVYSHLVMILAPYALLSATPLSPFGSEEKGPGHTWAQPVFKLCATTHTSHIATLPRLTKSEKLLLGAVQGVNKEICRVLVDIWAEAVESGLSQDQVGSVPQLEVDLLVQTWKRKTNALMMWLDWSVWSKCTPACTLEEICYLPTWPFFRGPDMIAVLSDPEEPIDSSWQRPKPKCISRLEPFDGLLF